eukprot:2205420-Rhodomonas_salina.1
MSLIPRCLGLCLCSQKTDAVDVGGCAEDVEKRWREDRSPQETKVANNSIDANAHTNTNMHDHNMDINNNINSVNNVNNNNKDMNKDDADAADLGAWMRDEGDDTSDLDLDLTSNTAARAPNATRTRKWGSEAGEGCSECRVWSFCWHALRVLLASSGARQGVRAAMLAVHVLMLLARQVVRAVLLPRAVLRDARY